MTEVSVVIPTYYRNEHLARAIASVEAQTHAEWEVIVVDGSGEAHARPVTDPYGPEVRYVAQDADEGPHAARSEGASVARGDYVNFLDDDDQFHPGKLERQLARAAEMEAGVIYCGVEWEGGHRILPDPAVQGDVLEYALRFQMTPSSPSAMLIDADDLVDILPLSNRHGADDMGMKIELAQRTRFAFVDDVLLTKGTASESLGTSWANVEGRFELLDRYADLYADHPRARRVALAHTYLLAAELRLENRLWSPRAIADAGRACYHVPGVRLPFYGYLVASLFGRAGRDVGRHVYDRFVLGDEHRGKVT